MTTHTEEIEALGKEVWEKQSKIIELMRAGPHEEVEDYVLKGEDGQDVRLSELFGDKPDLIAVHNMGRGCPYCTLWADGFNGVVPHLEDRAAFVVISPDAPEVQKEFADGRGWTFRMISAAGSSFTKDLGYETEHEGKPFALPGVSTFRKKDDGAIVRVAHHPFGPGDPFSGIWHLFGLLDGGVGEWQPKMGYGA